VDFNGLVRNITQSGRFTFDSDGKIAKFDIVNINIGIAFDEIPNIKNKTENMIQVCGVADT
jgi:hypothetical protein